MDYLKSRTHVCNPNKTLIVLWHKIDNDNNDNGENNSETRNVCHGSDLITSKGKRSVSGRKLSR